MLDDVGTGLADAGARGADLYQPVLAALLGARSEALAGPVVDDQPRTRVLGEAGDVCGLYLNPPENAVIRNVDEKSGMQAKSRINAA